MTVFPQVRVVCGASDVSFKNAAWETGANGSVLFVYGYDTNAKRVELATCAAGTPWMVFACYENGVPLDPCGVEPKK